MKRVLSALVMFTLCMLPGTLTARHYYYQRTHIRVPTPKPKPAKENPTILKQLDSWPIPIIVAFACMNPEVYWCQVYHPCANGSLARGGRELR